MSLVRVAILARCDTRRYLLSTRQHSLLLWAALAHDISRLQVGEPLPESIPTTVRFRFGYLNKPLKCDCLEVVTESGVEAIDVCVTDINEMPVRGGKKNHRCEMLDLLSLEHRFTEQLVSPYLLELGPL